MDAPDLIILFLILSRPHALLFLSLLKQFRISLSFMTTSRGGDGKCSNFIGISYDFVKGS